MLFQCVYVYTHVTSKIEMMNSFLTGIKEHSMRKTHEVKGAAINIRSSYISSHYSSALRYEHLFCPSNFCPEKHPNKCRRKCELWSVEAQFRARDTHPEPSTSKEGRHPPTRL